MINIPSSYEINLKSSWKGSQEDSAQPALNSDCCNVWMQQSILSNRAIFIWPWNENARTKQKHQTKMVILQQDWPIEQCVLHLKVFFGGKMKSPCFDLFIHWLIKQRTSTYRSHYSRSYENRSNYKVSIHHLYKCIHNRTSIL